MVGVGVVMGGGVGWSGEVDRVRLRYRVRLCISTFLIICKLTSGVASLLIIFFPLRIPTVYVDSLLSERWNTILHS